MRLQIEVSEDRVAEIKLLMSATGIETYKELFNNAISLLEWSINEVRSGQDIVSIKADGTPRELRMPILDGLKRSR